MPDSFNTHWTYEQACRVVYDFTEGLNGDNPEYERGQLELLADLFPIVGVGTGDRAERIRKDICAITTRTIHEQQADLDAAKLGEINEVIVDHTNGDFDADDALERIAAIVNDTPVEEEEMTGECPSCRRARPAISPSGILAIGSVCPVCGHVEPENDGDPALPASYRPDNMLGNIISVLSERTGISTEQVCSLLSAEYGDGDFDAAESAIWDLVGPMLDDIQNELGLED